MTANVTFRPYTAADRPSCLEVFDANCPEFFAPNERTHYERFLDSTPLGYESCLLNGRLVGAFGLMWNESARPSLRWMLLAPMEQGRGIGSLIMARVVTLAHESKSSVIDIAASHKSAPFFTRFGAKAIATINDGWGPAMHRIDMELHP